MTKTHIPTLKWKNCAGRLSELLRQPDFEIVDVPAFQDIEKLAAETNGKGPLPLWDGYAGVYDNKRVGPGAQRTSNQVRTSAAIGRFYTSLVTRSRPASVVEFGTAFGVSGMYWLCGLEIAAGGMLYTFEPNGAWRDLAVENLRGIGSRFLSLHGTFEELIDSVPLPAGGIDIAFVDAIHTSAFVHKQVEIVKAHMPAGGLIVLDDIRFSDDMYECWSALSECADAAASVEIGSRVGVLEYARP